MGKRLVSVVTLSHRSYNMEGCASGGFVRYVGSIRCDAVCADSRRIDLANQHQSSNADKVMNGIAYRRSSDTFFVTGKLWDAMYELRIDIAQG